MPQPVRGPDGQLYQFPEGTTKEQAIAYFKRKGIGAKAGAAPKMAEIRAASGLKFGPQDMSIAERIRQSGVDPSSIASRFGSGVKGYIEDARQHAAKFLEDNAPAILGTVGGLATGGLAAPAGLVPEIAAATAGAGAGGAAGAPKGQRVKDAAEQAAWELGGRIPGIALKGARVAARAAKRLAPEVRTIEGETIPQLAGETSPNSSSGRLQRLFKSGGEGAEKFADVEKTQQKGAKSVIRKAFESATKKRIIPAEPAAMAKAASKALQNRAGDLYENVFASGVDVPFDADALPATGPVRDAWNRVTRKLDIPADAQRYPNKPVALMHQFRSELKASAEASRDVTGRMDLNGKILSDAADEVDEAMQKSLAKQNPKAYLQWRRANTLWTRSYALDRIQEALAKATQGTPAFAQAGTKLPTEIHGSSLVKSLNDLDRNGSLARAFPDGGKSVRAVADLLDRAQRENIGKGSLRNVYLLGKYGTYITIAAGSGILEGKHSGAKRGFETFAAAALLAGIGEHYGTKRLVTLMTDPEGAKAIKALADSKSYGSLAKWGSVVARLAAGGGRFHFTGSAPAPRAESETTPAPEMAMHPTDAWASPEQ